MSVRNVIQELLPCDVIEVYLLFSGNKYRFFTRKPVIKPTSNACNDARLETSTLTSFLIKAPPRGTFHAVARWLSADQTLKPVQECIDRHDTDRRLIWKGLVRMSCHRPKATAEATAVQAIPYQVPYIDITQNADL